MDAVDLNLLVTLDALLQEGSVSGAARRVGLSTPAVSHALARLRERLADPVLVRSGRRMVLTPRAEALKGRVHSVVTEARLALARPEPFTPRALARSFVVHGSDYVLSVLGLLVDGILREEAPGVSLRIVPNSPEDSAQLQAGSSDLAVGIYGTLPQEMRSRTLLTDRFVCVLRRGHPALRGRFTLERYVALPHLQIAPRGMPGGYVDDVLRERGLERRVARAVPYFLTALQWAAATDYVLTVSERIAQRYAGTLGLVAVEAPVPLRPYALSLVWHPRVDGDAGHRFLREVFLRAAETGARERHPAARKRLDPSDPTSGERRKRPRLLR